MNYNNNARTKVVIVAMLTLAASCLSSCGAPAHLAPPLPVSYDWSGAIARIGPEPKADREFGACLANAARSCEEQYGQRTALGSDDLGTCGQLSDPSVQSACRLAVVDARIARGADERACLKLPHEEQTGCFEKHIAPLAITAKDAKVCLKFAPYFSGAQADYEVSLCVIQALQALGGKGAVDICPYLRHEGNRTLCENIFLIPRTGSGIKTSPESKNS